MKRFAAIIFALLICFASLSFAACLDRKGNASGEITESGKSTEKENNGGEKEETENTAEKGKEENEKNGETPEEVEAPKADVDLSAMSGTMVYAEVYNIMLNPAKYERKIIKVRGTYRVSYYPPTEKFYNYVLIADATGCCAQGLEFIAAKSISSENYPAIGTEIEIVGAFKSYEELGKTYYQIEAEFMRVVRK